MATIALYSNKIAQMSGLLGETKKTVSDYKSELFSLKTKALAIKQSICNMEDVIGSIQASTSVQEEKVDSLEQVRGSSEQFIEDTYRIDGNVADLVNKRKDDFYDQYKYLKPECEKNGWEKFKDGCEKVGEWCKEHWKIIVTVVLVIAAIVLIVVTGGLVLGPILTILVEAAKGLIAGAIIGGIIGGLSSVAAGGSFFEGFEEGAFSGACIGALFGGIGGIGQVIGKSCKVLEHLGKIAKIVPTVSKVSGGISLGMAGFDLLSLGVSLFDPKSPLVQFNKKLHSSKLYNGFQITVSTLAIFTAGFTKGMKNPICFVAGTMVLTTMGLKAIETIQAGDQVIAANPDTFQTEEKKVVETYINKTTCIVKIIIQNEEIYTTMNHPFYVKGQGFVSAGKLSMGDELMNASGGRYPVECIELEERQEVVYNFQVEDYHTYYVGENSILVHNDCPEDKAPTEAGSASKYSGDLEQVSKPDPAADALAERINGQSRVKYSNDPSGREFDAISNEYIAQAKPPLSTVNKSVRNQMKASFEAAKSTGKKVYYQFEGEPAQSVIDKLYEYSERYGVEVVIDTKPLGITN